ncbi:MAG: FkbM family methyltransferase [Pseudomonadota bacterium]
MNFLSRLRLWLLSLQDSVSQASQDLWVIEEAAWGKRNGYFVDIGAHDGVKFSNTFLLERRYGWSDLLIEANPASFEKCRAARRAKSLNLCLDETDGEVDFAPHGMMGGIVAADTDNADVPEDAIRVRTRRLQDVLDEQNAPKVIGYLSIDVEGAEERVLRSFDFNAYRFNCITIERPSQMLRDRFREAGYIEVRHHPNLDTYLIHETFLETYNRNQWATAGVFGFSIGFGGGRRISLYRRFSKKL